MLGAVFLLAVGFVGGTLPSPLYAIYQKQIGFSPIVLTLVYAAYVIGTLAVLLGLGRISDQLGRRWTAFAGVAIGAVSALIFVIDPGAVATLYAGRIASGLSVGLVTGAATAWITELHPRGDRAAAGIASAVGNLAGIGAGPLLAGILADVAPAPLRLPYLAYAALLVPALVIAVRTRETVERRVTLGEVDLRPRLGVPRAIRAQFLAPAIAGFGAFALFGFYSAIGPSFISQRLHAGSHALAGAIIVELCAVAIAAIVATRGLNPRTAMLGGLVQLIPGLALVVLADRTESLAVFVAATAFVAVGFGLGYRGSLQVINLIAPATQRAEVMSAYFVFCYVGVSLPIIGVGVVSQLAGLAAATVAFAAVIALLSIAAALLGARLLPRAA